MYVCICKLESQRFCYLGLTQKALNLGKISLILSQDTPRLQGRVTRLDYTREKYLWIVKRGFAAKTIVDEQLSEAEMSSSVCR